MRLDGIRFRMPCGLSRIAPDTGQVDFGLLNFNRLYSICLASPDRIFFWNWKDIWVEAVMSHGMMMGDMVVPDPLGEISGIMTLNPLEKECVVQKNRRLRRAKIFRATAPRLRRGDNAADFKN